MMMLVIMVLVIMTRALAAVTLIPRAPLLMIITLTIIQTIKENPMINNTHACIS